MKYVMDYARVGKWVAEKAGGKYIEGSVAFGIEKDGILVAGVMYNGYTGENGSIAAHWRVDDPKSLTRYFYRIAFDYPFNVAKVRRMNGLVHSSNHRAIKVNTKLGFTKDAVLENYFPDGDGIIFRMYRHECRFIRD